MTTPLPPLPKTDLGLCFFDEGGAHPCDGAGYTAEQMQAYAAQARADLEAENARLRQQIDFALVALRSGAPEYDLDDVEDILRTALKETP